MRLRRTATCSPSAETKTKIFKEGHMNNRPMFRLLEAREIDCRVAQIAKPGKSGQPSGLSLLLYKDARCDQNILDETVGPMNWTRHHSRDNANCTVAIWDQDKREWVEKEDTGTESNTEAEKGLASDSFKRACFNWGIGRELYSAPFIWIPSANCKIESDDRTGKFLCRDRFEVAEIEYDEHREISKLTIYNNTLKAVAFSFSNGKSVKVEPAPMTEERIRADAVEIDPDYNTEAKATPAHVSLLKDYYKGEDLKKLLAANNIERLEDLPALKAGELLSKLAQRDAAKAAKREAAQ